MLNKKNTLCVAVCGFWLNAVPVYADEAAEAVPAVTASTMDASAVETSALETVVDGEMGSEGVAVESPALAETDDRIQSILQWLGFYSVLQHTDALIAAEMDYFSASPQAMTDAQIAAVKQQYTQLTAKQLSAGVIEHLRAQLDETTLLAVHAMMASAEGEQLVELMQAARAQSDKFDIYQFKLNEQPVLGPRLVLAQQLSGVAGLATFRSHVQLELRKHLLATATQVKHQKSIDEAALQQQLAGYFASVETQINQEASQQYLFMLRYVPSDDIDALVELLAKEPVQAVMKQSVIALQNVLIALR